MVSTHTTSSETDPQWFSGEMKSQPSIDVQVDSKRYSAGKPHRVVIRGKISK
jgi:hypothetical protein